MLCNEYGNVVMANLRTETEIGSDGPGDGFDGLWFGVWREYFRDAKTSIKPHASQAYGLMILVGCGMNDADESKHSKFLLSSCHSFNLHRSAGLFIPQHFHQL
eukprot:scaffold202926_cov86-Cyclotella_meneghiniana.AAC.2